MVVNGLKILKIYNADVRIATRTCLCYRLHVMMYNPLYIHEGKTFI